MEVVIVVKGRSVAGGVCVVVMAVVVVPEVAIVGVSAEPDGQAVAVKRSSMSKRTCFFTPQV